MLTKSEIQARGLTLGVDLDGVVFDFDAAWCRRRGVEPGQPQRWGDLHLLGGFDSPGHFWRWFMDSGGFESLPLIPGAREALWFVVNRGWSIVYVTNRPEEDVSRQEIEKHRLPMAEVCHTSNKAEVEADLFVEDAPHNLLDIGPGRAIRVQRPWNSPTHYPWIVAWPSIPDLETAHIQPHLEHLEWVAARADRT